MAVGKRLNLAVATSNAASAVSGWATNRRDTAERDVAVAVFSAQVPTSSCPTR
jgi:hypothetical protein